MKKLLTKLFLYGVLIAIAFELIIRLSHLYFEYPVVRLNKNKVVNYIPGQKGAFVLGNRRMNYAKFHINQSGFNSYQEFNPTKEDLEVALIGDSFVEGLHQDFDNSIGKKVENHLNGSVKVFEYGFSGYDLADQLHLMHQYKDQMYLIDVVFIYLNFDEDLRRDHYEIQTRANLENNLAFKVKREIKLLSYLNGIGLIAPITELPKRIKSVLGNKGDASNIKVESESPLLAKEYMDNFSALLEMYPIDKDKCIFLINEPKTDLAFMKYCDTMGYKYLDFGKALQNSEENTVLKYDPMKHWNNHGRDIVAKLIAGRIDSIQKSAAD